MALEDTHHLVFLEKGGKGLWCGHWPVEVEQEEPERDRESFRQNSGNHIWKWLCPRKGLF